LKLLAHAIAFLVLVLDQPVRGVILEDVGNVGHGFRTDLVGGDQLDVVEPAVGIEPALGRLAPQLGYASRPAL
jgi:hypothetical protein